MPDHNEEICVADEPLHNLQENVWYNYCVTQITHRKEGENLEHLDHMLDIDDIFGHSSGFATHTPPHMYTKTSKVME